MNWNEVRSPIKISTSDIKSLTHEISKKKEWANLREKTIKKQKNICRYCGGKYYKYLYCFYVDKDVDICCKICYMITNINYGFNEEIILLYSTKSQLEIIR